MGVKATGVKELQAQIRAVLAHLESETPMLNICNDVKERVLERTAAGKDYRGRRFARYSPKYAARKGSNKVDLRLSGDMMDSIKVKVISPQRGEIRITAHELIANIHTQGIGKQPQRDFMDIPDSALQKFVNKHHDDEIMRILGRR